MPEFKMFDKVLVRDSEDDNWVATFFSHYDIEGHVIAINDASWEYCIPALGNEHLVWGRRIVNGFLKKATLLQSEIVFIVGGSYVFIAERMFATARSFILQVLRIHLAIMIVGNFASQQKSILNLILRRIDNA